MEDGTGLHQFGPDGLGLGFTRLMKGVGEMGW
jgi:hypothetical protein